MPLSNINQILIRNIDLLDSNQPLLVNIDAVELIPEWLSHYPTANLTCFNNNFAQFQSIKSMHKNKVSTFFGSHYEQDVIHDLVVIAFPKSKAELAFSLAMIAHAVNDETTIIFVGDNKGGIKSVAKQSRDYIANCIKQDNARHCLLFTGQYLQPEQPFSLAHWFNYYDVTVADEEIKIAALPGVFSQKGLDKGTSVLLENLPNTIQGKVLDFGCGAGIISAVIGKLYPKVSLTLIDVSALAIASAEQTLANNQISGQCIASDGLSHVNTKFNTIISNPPFHQGLKTHYAATETFLKNCAKQMHENGTLIVVANNFLKYQPIMSEFVGNTDRLAVDNGFTVYLSQK